MASSWTTAYTTVQDALDLANANSGVSYEIWVAEGVYYPDEGDGHVDNEMSESFRIEWDNVQIYGGFGGYGISETLRTQRDWVAHPTILSGDIDQDDANADGNFIAEMWADIQGSNARHVLWLDGVTNQAIDGATVLDGFTITGGNANGGSASTNSGGGLYCNGLGAGSICSPPAGDANYQATVSAALTQTITAPQPLAVNDAAGVLEGEAVTIAVLANDRDPAGGGLTVVAVSQPAHGVTSIDAGHVTVRYAANPGAGGLDSLTYTLQDANGQQRTATVAVVVTVLTETDVPPQVAGVDPALPHTLPFTSTQATVTVDVPAGVYTGVLAPAQIFFLSYTPIVTPTAHTLTPPGTLHFGGVQFELAAFIDDVPQPGFRFAQPITLTIRYNPALLHNLLPGTLALTFWDGTGWSTDGIVIQHHDLATATLTSRLRI